MRNEKFCIVLISGHASSFCLFILMKSCSVNFIYIDFQRDSNDPNCPNIHILFRLRRQLKIHSFLECDGKQTVYVFFL